MVSIGIARCEPPPLNNQYGVPGNYAGGGGGGNNNVQQQGGNGFDNHHQYDGGSDHDYADQPMAYEFGYAVKDQATGNDFGRRESSDGETVRGEYRVQLPDGRTQIVTYTADWRTGFHADVRYEGTASYPDQYNTQNNNYNNNNNNNNNNQGYNNNQGGQGFGFHGNNAGGFNTGNNGGYNYQAPAGNYNPYQFGSNSLDSGYNNNFGARNNNYNTRIPSPTYGPGFKK